ncbi:MAG: hypothetical protein JXA43_01670 [Candidatus Diapherotrites archaeon]|nr:hypothetical protein [Candidatus Diapherotrites archaeon]
MERVLLSKKETIDEELAHASKHAKAVYINIPLKASDVVKILNYFKGLEILYLPPSAFKLTSKKIKEALKKSNIEVRKIETAQGRPQKYGEDLLEQMKNLVNNGLHAKEISELLNMPLRTVYFFLKKFK